MKKTVKKKKILIIDDDSAYLNSLKWRLMEYFEVKFSQDKKQAELVLKHYHPDMIILDVNLNPFKSDYHDSLNILKQVKETRDIKVVIVTVDDRPDIREIFLQCGADCYLNKPLSLDQLFNLVYN